MGNLKVEFENPKRRQRWQVREVSAVPAGRGVRMWLSNLPPVGMAMTLGLETESGVCF